MKEKNTLRLSLSLGQRMVILRSRASGTLLGPWTRCESQRLNELSSFQPQYICRKNSSNAWIIFFGPDTSPFQSKSFLSFLPRDWAKPLCPELSPQHSGPMASLSRTFIPGIKMCFFFFFCTRFVICHPLTHAIRPGKTARSRCWRRDLIVIQSCSFWLSRLHRLTFFLSCVPL